MTARRLTGFVIACAISLGLISLELSGWPEDRGQLETTVSIPSANPRPVASRLPLPSLQTWVPVILSRPLFSANRRPSPKTAAGTTDAKVTALPRLAGVLVSSSGRSAIFAGPQGGKPITATEGNRIGAFLVQVIEAGRVTVLGPNGPLTVHPAFDSTKAPEQPVVPPSPMANHREMQELFRKGVGPTPAYPGLPTLGKN